MKHPQIITIYPRGSRLKVECRIFDTRRAMLVEAKKFTQDLYPNLGKDTMAYCEPTLKLMPSKSYLAVVFFNRNDWSHGIIAHEFDHCANALMYRCGVRQIPCSLDMATDLEEEHCYIMESLVDAFHKKYKL